QPKKTRHKTGRYSSFCFSSPDDPRSVDLAGGTILKRETSVRSFEFSTEPDSCTTGSLRPDGCSLRLHNCAIRKPHERQLYAIVPDSDNRPISVIRDRIITASSGSPYCDEN